MVVIELFKQITNIPRCSGVYKPFIDYIKEFADLHGYICQIDGVNNILCCKKNSMTNVCLQSHYDIVCLEDGKIPQIIEEDGYLKAKDSTLGADNGIGCAMMMALMIEQKDCEFLFTSDEEIGLIGANAIEFNLQSQFMLNLDSEVEGDICIGCAGGVDIFASIEKGNTISNNEKQKLYSMGISNLDGGHSGVDIDKNIPNAIKLIAKTIKDSNAKILDINGGERTNSIPKSCNAIIVSSIKPMPSHPNMIIEEIDTISSHYTPLSPNITNFLYSFAQGVRGYDRELNVVLSSINLATIETTIDSVNISFSARAMDNDELTTITNETFTLLKAFGFDVKTSGKYPAWKPTHNPFAAKVLEVYKKHIPEASLEAIHAGLECAIFKNKYPNMQIASIGPNIYFPHSHREKVEISSIAKVYSVVQDIVHSAG